ncbi:MAG: ribulose-phosphate 3-epimerase [Candidatus Daviesbacteria bacterium]|nr:ribulose-phosphate 3-epimerase [Candidatus Daviesbacteria bacterium]
MVQIIPAILSISEADYDRDISRYKASQSFQDGWIHIDFMDNVFVPNKSIDAAATAKYPTPLQKEAHIMVAHPKEWVDDLVEANFERIIFHVEVEDDKNECIDYIKSKGAEVGLAINNATSLKMLEPFLGKVDMVLVMSVVPGFQGQPFIPESLDRIKEISQIRSQSNFSFKISIDGAVKDTNVKEIASSGVDFVTVGSFLLKGDLDENLERLWEVVK